jgi:hypothetical protein
VYKVFSLTEEPYSDILIQSLHTFNSALNLDLVECVLLNSELDDKPQTHLQQQFTNEHEMQIATEKFSKWCVDNGVIMPKLKYTKQADGLLGINA